MPCASAIISSLVGAYFTAFCTSAKDLLLLSGFFGALSSGFGACVGMPGGTMDSLRA